MKSVRALGASRSKVGDRGAGTTVAAYGKAGDLAQHGAPGAAPAEAADMVVDSKKAVFIT
jgi:hypothetical protein